MNKSGNIGTVAETAAVRALQKLGWPGAERRRLNGRDDRGDVTGTPGICWEVKGGAVAKNASDAQIALWLHETERERSNAGADIGVLVVQRRGIGAPNAHRWWAIVHGNVLGLTTIGDLPVRLTLDAMCHWLRSQGYGTELEEATV